MSQAYRVIGIDPGMSGGLAALVADPQPRAVFSAPLPIEVITPRKAPPPPPRRKGGKKKRAPAPERSIDVAALIELLEEAGVALGGAPHMVAVERQFGRQNESRQSTLTIGRGVGRIEASASAMGWRPHIVEPQTWQVVHVGSPYRDLKGAVGRKARSVWVCQRTLPDLQLYPDAGNTPHDGIADAGCIALWALKEVQTRSAELRALTGG